MKKTLSVLMTCLLAFALISEARSASFSYRKKVTIDHTKVSGSSSLSSFPVLVSITADNDLRTTGSLGHVQRAKGYDIIFRTSDGTTLDHEIEKYDGSSGTLAAWVRIPALSPTSDTVFYIYYGNSDITSPTENVTGV